MTEPLLQISDLRIETVVDHRKKSAVSTQVLQGIDLTLNRGEVIGLIGESGAGKSTLGLAAMGFVRRGLRISGGEIWLDGQDLRQCDSETLRAMRGQKVAYVAQSAAAAFNPAHKLLGQVLEVTYIHRHMDSAVAKQRAVTLFERMGLPHPERFGQSYPHEVSGGQLQRAMTAMALAGQPDLLVLDEPTTALDVTTQIDVLAIIKEVIENSQSAALYITHDLGVVVQVADRIKVLRYGKEVEEQDTATLLAEPLEDYTRELLNVRKQTFSSTEPADSGDILTVTGIDAAYGAMQVLFDVSINLKLGKSLAIVGESGSGKSTLARVITGLLPLIGGKMTYFGKSLSPNLAGRSDALRKSIQIIYQMPDLAMNPRQTIKEIVGRPAEVFLGLSGKASENKVRALLELVDLSPDLVNRYPNQLSGGQKQRVCIARALAAEPNVIICDEVTSALDPLVAEGIIQLLLRLQKDTNVSYIFITHDMAMVSAIADDVVVMQNGKVVEQGTKDEIFAPPYQDYTHLLINSTPQMRTGWLENVIKERRIEAGDN
jgi:peptide/nickel transport system ATP-binding protein